MISVGDVDEALVTPMVDGALRIDSNILIERGEASEAELPSTDMVPNVTIGMPRAWRIELGLAIRELDLVVRGDETARPAPDRITFTNRCT